MSDAARVPKINATALTRAVAIVDDMPGVAFGPEEAIDWLAEQLTQYAAEQTARAEAAEQKLKKMEKAYCQSLNEELGRSDAAEAQVALLRGLADGVVVACETMHRSAEGWTSGGRALERLADTARALLAAPVPPTESHVLVGTTEWKALNALYLESRRLYGMHTDCGPCPNCVLWSAVDKARQG